MCMSGSIGAWLFACLFSGPEGIPAVRLKGFWGTTDTNTKTSRLLLLADFLFSPFFHVLSNYQTKHSEKRLLGEIHQKKLCDTHQVRHTVCRVWLTLWSNLEKKGVLLGHQYLASLCGWRWLTQRETNRLSMRVQKIPQQMLNETFIYDSSGWVLIISWT